MKIAIVVLHYRNLSDTLECLDSLQKLDYASYEILLIDNGSKDLGLDVAVKKYSSLYLIRNQDNLGFAQGCNVGIQSALERGAEAVLLLNNDTVVSCNLLSVFSQAAITHPEAGVFGAKILFYDDPTVIWHAGGDVHPRTIRCYHHGCLESDLEKKWDEVRQVNYACGCALFVKKEAIEKVGLMAPQFFLIWEEIDWCWRIRNAGFSCLYIPQARVWHKISRSFEEGNRGPLWQYYFFRNRLLFFKRNYSPVSRLRFYLSYFPKELGQIMWSIFNPKTSKETKKQNLFALKGIRDYFTRRFF